MPKGFASALFAITALTVTSVFSSGTVKDVLRYRGSYTYGHEVRAFCPAINSQCYWVGADTSAFVQGALEEVATVPGNAPYTPVCVVLEGRIDRETPRTGFAADYSGLITVTRLYGRCDETDIVTEGDLQHHRWLLHSVGGTVVDAVEFEGAVPELDFGERMTVTGSYGCNRFSGQASLRDRAIVFERMSSTRRLCSEKQNAIERTVQRVLYGQPVVKIDAVGQLMLEAGQIELRFFLSDWKN
ncbi:MAG: META domain-containing protein [Burkholderiales bacterium]|jgi:heat shock protein HslJ